MLIKFMLKELIQETQINSDDFPDQPCRGASLRQQVNDRPRFPGFFRGKFGRRKVKKISQKQFRIIFLKIHGI